jgi:Ca2+-binding EF-hand superfamily protein
MQDLKKNIRRHSLNLSDIFQKVDKDGSGFIDKQEF